MCTFLNNYFPGCTTGCVHRKSPICTIFGHFYAKCSKMMHFWSILDTFGNSGISRGHILDHFWTILDHFWTRFIARVFSLKTTNSVRNVTQKSTLTFVKKHPKIPGFSGVFRSDTKSGQNGPKWVQNDPKMPRVSAPVLGGGKIESYSRGNNYSKVCILGSFWPPKPPRNPPKSPEFPESPETGPLFGQKWSIFDNFWWFSSILIKFDQFLIILWHFCDISAQFVFPEFSTEFSSDKTENTVIPALNVSVRNMCTFGPQNHENVRISTIFAQFCAFCATDIFDQIFDEKSSNFHWFLIKIIDFAIKWTKNMIICAHQK